MCSLTMVYATLYSSRIEEVRSVKAVADIFKVKLVFGMTTRPSTLSQVEIINKLLYNYLQAVCKKEDDWLSHLATI